MNELDLFAAAIAMADPVERAALLERECVGRADLRQRLDRLLAAHAQSHPLLDAGDPGLTAGYDPPPSLVGTVIAGRYKLLEEIGEGGMGTVWVAEQTEPVKRKVALKLIKAGMDSKSVLARFEAERQALAVMDHPNIAKVLDGGLTEAGRPFFVMEYVKGIPITEYCDATKLSIVERLNLFVQVCSAVQHAHQKGIIHRDLKPSNILVAPYDDKPVPKVIDFGLAKAMHQSLTERTLHTAHETVLGTPLYMSPEQAQLNNLDVDTRSDIYSLGVLLYELLTGTTPLEKQRFKEAAWDEIRRIIREEEPPRPSTRLSSTNTLPSLAVCRHTEPMKLTKQVRGELDWIVMKALEKDRTRRYETANGFAMDLERYLAGEPVLAHPPSTVYRLKKFVRRNRGQVIAASLVFVALLAGVIGTGIGMLRANRSAENERLAKLDAQVKQKKAELAEQRERDRAEGERQARERETVERARAEKAYARTADVLDAMVSEVTGDSLATQKTITAEQKKFLAEVLTYYQEFAGEKGDDEKTRRRTAQAALRVGLIESRLGRKEEAVAAFRRSRDGLAVLAAEFPSIPDDRHQLAKSHHNLGWQLADLGKRPEAEEQYRLAQAIWEKLAAEFPAVPDYRQGLASSHNNLGILLADLGKRPEAEEQYRKALTILEKLDAEFHGPMHRRVLAATHLNLGTLLRELGKRLEAEEQYRQALAIGEKLAAEFPAVPEHCRDLAASHLNLGLRLADLGKRAEAEEQHRKALAIFEKLATDFPAAPQHRQELARSHNNLGILLLGLGKRPEAEVQYRKALAIGEKLAAEFPAVPLHRQDLAKSHNGLGILLAGLGKRAEAEEQCRQALAIQVKLAAEFSAVPQYRQDLAGSHINLALLLSGLGYRPEVEEQYRMALTIQEKLTTEFPGVPQHSHDLARSHTGLGNLLAGQGKRQEAEVQYRKALAIQEKLVAEHTAVPVHRQDLAGSHNSLGLLLAGLGKRSDAEEQYRQALAIRESLAAEFPAVPAHGVSLGGSYCNLGNLVRDDGKLSDSLAWFAKAIRTLAPIHKREPRDMTARQFLRNSHWGRAVAYVQLRQYAEAIPDWDKTIELSPQTEQLSLRASRATSRSQAGQVAEAVAEVVELTKLSIWTAGQWYDFACIHAIASGKLADQKDELARRSVELLQRAVQAGYKDAAQIKKDTYLDPLRNRDDFKKLLAELQARKEPEKK